MWKIENFLSKLSNFCMFYQFLGGQMPNWLDNSGTGIYKRSSGRPAGFGFDEDAIKNAFFGKL